MPNRSISTSDFEGAANIFLTSSEVERLNEVYTKFSVMEHSNLPSYFPDGEMKIDMVISNASYNYKDHNQLLPVIGDTFYHFFYGKSPMTLGLQGVVFDVKGPKAITDFKDIYKYLLRISMVAKTGIIPKIMFKNCIVSGAFLSLQTSHNSETYDHATFEAKVLVFKLDYENMENEGQASSVSINYSIDAYKNRDVPAPELEVDEEAMEGFERRVAYDDHAAFADEEVEYVSNKEYFAT